MSTHPATRQHMDCIYLCTRNLYPEEENERRLRLSLESEALSDMELQERKRKHLSQYNEIAGQEVRIFDLMDILGRMQRNGYEPGVKQSDFKLSCTDNQAKSAVPWGYDRISHALGYDNWMNSNESSAPNTCSVILAALARTLFKPPELELGNLNNPLPLNQFGRILSTRASSNPFENLRVLRLTLTISRNDLKHSHAAKSKLLREFAQSFHEIRRAKQLHTLSLTVSPHRRDDKQLGWGMFDGVFFKRGVIEYPRTLRVLELDGHAISVVQLRAVLYEMRNQLEKLSLRNIRHPKEMFSASHSRLNVMENNAASQALRLEIGELMRGCEIRWQAVYCE